MLDQEHPAAELLRELLNEQSELVAFGFGHPGGRFVKQQKTRLKGERARDANPPFVGIGQGVRSAVRDLL
jgi:hypothetical protein